MNYKKLNSIFANEPTHERIDQDDSSMNLQDPVWQKMFPAFDKFRKSQQPLIDTMQKEKVNPRSLKDLIEQIERDFNAFKQTVRPIFYDGTRKYTYLGSVKRKRL